MADKCKKSFKILWFMSNVFFLSIIFNFIVPNQVQAEITDNVPSGIEVLDEQLYKITYQDNLGYELVEKDELTNQIKTISENTSYALPGDTLVFALQNSGQIVKNSNIYIYADGILCNQDSEGFYRVEDVNSDLIITMAGQTKGSDESPVFYNVTLENEYENIFQVKNANDLEERTISKVVSGGYYTFSVNVPDDYRGSSYTVSSDNHILEPDTDGNYKLLIEKDSTISINGTPTVAACVMNLSYDNSLYDVTLDDVSVTDGTEVTLSAKTSKTLVVEKLGSEDIAVIAGGQKIEPITTDDSSATFVLTYSTSMDASFNNIYITKLACTATADESSKYTILYPSGRFVPYGSKYIVGIQLNKGYTNSKVDVVADGTYIHAPSGSFVFDHEENSIYYYTCSNMRFDFYSLYISSENAATKSSQPITANSYTARFIYNDGSTDVNLDYGTKLNAIASPTKTGYYFLGWYTSTGRKYDFTKKVTQNINLFAHWEETCQVTFTGDTINTVSKTVLKNNTVSKPVTPVRLGYKFLGWYTDDLGCDLYDFDTPVTSDITLYGIWEYDPIDISKATVTKIGAKTYTGSAIKPALKLTYKGSTLKSGKDYTVTYSSNVKVGTAVVKITGIGVYKNSRTVHFLINPKPTKITKIVNKKSKKLIITWNKVSGAAGYQIYRSTSKNGTYKKIAAVKGSVKTYTDKKLKKKKTYYYKVTVVMKNGKYYESAKSNVKYAKVKK